MKNKALLIFSSKNKNKKLKCRLLQNLFGALRVKDDILCESFARQRIHMKHQALFS